MPLISVVIPCYNAAKYIEVCLAALEKQTFSDFEVILVDDCSSDNTEQVIKQFQSIHQLNICYLKNRNNMGPGNARNRGIAHSDAKYIAFCDSDDWYELSYLQRMAEAAVLRDADIVLCNSQKVMADGKIFRINNIGNLTDMSVTKDVLTVGIDSLCCLMVKRSIIIDIPQPDIYNGEDMAIIPLMIMRSSRFAYVKDYIYNYLCRSGSLSLKVDEKVVQSLEKSFDYIMEHADAGFDTELEYIGIKNVVYGALLNHFKYSKDYFCAKEILLRFEERFPTWKKNPYVSRLNFYKRIFIWMVGKNMFWGVHLFSRLHQRIVEKRK